MKLKLKPTAPFDPYKWRHCFAWFPQRLNDNVIWLERYSWRYKPKTYYENWAGNGGELEFELGHVKEGA